MTVILTNRSIAQPVPTYPSLQITTPSLPGATVGTSYSASMAATGGLAPYTWSAISTVPGTGSWLTLSTAGVFSGTPSTAETETVLVQVTDSTGTKNSMFFALVVSSGGSGGTLVPVFQYLASGFTSGVQSQFNLFNAAVFGPGTVMRVMVSTNGHGSGLGQYATTINATQFTTDFDLLMGSSARSMAFQIQNNSPVITGDADCAGYSAGSNAGQTPTLNSIGVIFMSGDKSSSGLNPGVSLQMNGGMCTGSSPGLNNNMFMYQPGQVWLGNYGYTMLSQVLHVHLSYDGAVLYLKMVNATTGQEIREWWPLGIAACLGASTGKFGFSGGGNSVDETINGWNLYSNTLTKVSTPVASVAGGQYSSTQTVSLSSQAGATIYYTTNGNTPSANSSVYSGPLTISQSTILQAVASQTGYEDSLLGEWNYQIQTSANTRLNLPSGFASMNGQMILTGSATLSGSNITLINEPTQGNGIGGTANSTYPVIDPTTNFNAVVGFTVTNNFVDGMSIIIHSKPNASQSGSVLSGGAGKYLFGANQGGSGAPGGAFCNNQGWSGAVPNSIGIYFDLANNKIGVTTTGQWPNLQNGTAVATTSITGLNLGNSNPKTVSIANNTTTHIPTILIKDLVTLATFPFTFSANIASLIGSQLAYISVGANVGGGSNVVNLNSITVQ